MKDYVIKLEERVLELESRYLSLLNYHEQVLGNVGGSLYGLLLEDFFKRQSNRRLLSGGLLRVEDIVYVIGNGRISGKTSFFKELLKSRFGSEFYYHDVSGGQSIFDRLRGRRIKGIMLDNCSMSLDKYTELLQYIDKFSDCILLLVI